MSAEYPLGLVVVAGDAHASVDAWQKLIAERLPGAHLRPLGDVTGRFGALVEELIPRTEVPSPAWLLQARRNAAARSSYLAEVGALTAEDIAELAGTKATNRRATASRWLKDGQIFAITHRGQRLFPGFQFDADTGKPKPVIGCVLETLPDLLVHGGWQLALWWATPTAWLDWRRPLDFIDEDPDAVVAAAASERSDWSAQGAAANAEERQDVIRSQPDEAAAPGGRTTTAG